MHPAAQVLVATSPCPDSKGSGIVDSASRSPIGRQRTRRGTTFGVWRDEVRGAMIRRISNPTLEVEYDAGNGRPAPTCRSGFSCAPRQRGNRCVLTHDS